MMRCQIVIVVAVALGLSGPIDCAPDNQTIADLGPLGPLTKVCTGLVFTEGPAADDHGNLFFTDLRDGPGKIYRLDAGGKLDLIVPWSDWANGLAFNRQGELVACQAKGQLVAYSPDGSQCRVLAGGYHGRRFNAPNDLVIDREGGIYFTDPFLDAPLPIPPQPRAAVYYVSPDGDVTRLINNLAQPNGIGLSPDEKTLYVVPSLRPEVMAYPIDVPGKIGPGRMFARLVRSGLPLYKGGDGMAVDVRGNLYIASHRGVQVFNAAGDLLGILTPPEEPSNVAFGGHDRKTLYITARRSVYAAPMAVAGW